MSTRYRILEGLPPYGPPAEPFSATGIGLHREGFVVEFLDSGGNRWTGNFQRGLTGLDVVADSPHGTNLVVIAGGEGYVIAPDDRRCVRTFGGQIDHLFVLPGRLVVSNGLWLEATDGERVLWSTRRISWDRLSSLRIEGELALGDSYDAMNGEWVPFTVDLFDGNVTGGAYPNELQR